MAPEADVVVVGAGLAGLTAARRLTQAGASVKVVEARDRVGGRTLNHKLANGNVVEVGGQWVGPTQHRMLALTQEVGVEIYPTYDRGENAFEWNGEMRRYEGAIPKINPAVLLDVLQAQKRLDRMARTVPLDAPWRAPKARQWDNQTVWSWLRRNVASRPAREILTLGCEAVWAAAPGDVSLLHFLFYTHSAGGLDALFDTAGGAQESRFHGGSQLVSLKMAEELDVELDAPVRTIAQDGSGVTVRTERGEFRGRRAIVAIPPMLAGRLVYDPPMPGHRDQLLQRMAQGSVIKCMAVYPEAFWRGDGLSGQATSLEGPVKLTFDNSPPDDSAGVLLGFLEGPQARRLTRLDQAERRRLVIDCFTRFFGPRAAVPEEYVDRSWAEEEYTRGCYGCGVATGGWTEFGDALRAPIGRLGWAGAEYGVVWNGYMDGAVSSGETAAQEALRNL
ncbi:MAG: flavin monoamine oxidase family protein [Thermoleophilaceae bacterium]|nr:flavin monoamine oxidase family protein [Thermoleophilaceae bacterium]